MNSRGEAWVAGQFVIGLTIAMAPASWPLVGATWLQGPGVALMVFGGLTAFAAMQKLGSNFTALPKPKENGHMVEAGLYRYVRHPIYFGVLLMALGWSLWRLSGWGLLLTFVLLLFFDAKARREELWLREQYDGYAAYQQRVKKLIPWLY